MEVLGAAQVRQMADARHGSVLAFSGLLVAGTQSPFAPTQSITRSPGHNNAQCGMQKQHEATLFQVALPLPTLHFLAIHVALPSSVLFRHRFCKHHSTLISGPPSSSNYHPRLSVLPHRTLESLDRHESRCQEITLRRRQVRDRSLIGTNSAAARDTSGRTTTSLRPPTS